MFGMFRYDGSENIEFVVSEKKSPGNESSGRGRRDFACKACREKKVRCSAQRTGCDRCKAKNISCVYFNRQLSTTSVSKRTANPTRLMPGKFGVEAERTERRASECASSSTSETTRRSPSSIPSQKMITNDLKIELPTPPGLDDLSFQIFHDYAPAENDFDMLDLGQDILPQLVSKNLSDCSDLDTAFDRDHDSHLDKDMSPATLSLLMTTPEAFNNTEALFESEPTFEALSALACGPLTPPTAGLSALAKQQALQNGSADACLCLQMLTTILERLILMKVSPPSAQQQQLQQQHGGHSLDLELAVHKAAIARCNTVLQCSCYSAQSEHVMMLIIVCERIVEMCDRLVGKYHQQLEPQCESRSQSPSHVTMGDLTPPLSVSPSSESSLISLTQFTPTTSIPLTPLAVGAFHISSINEWAVVMRAVIQLQLQSTMDLVERMLNTHTANGQRDTRSKLHQDWLVKLTDRLATMLNTL